MVPPKRKAFLYAGHDSTIANILGALGVWDPQMPEYGVTALFELLEDTDTNQFGVKVSVLTHHPHFTQTTPVFLSSGVLSQLNRARAALAHHSWL